MGWIHPLERYFWPPMSRTKELFAGTKPMGELAARRLTALRLDV
jgi:hypothetical protein